MGVCSYLVSDSTREYFEFGKILWPASVTAAMRPSADVDIIRNAICNTEHNAPCDPAEADAMAARAAAWMERHLDWRVVADCDADFDDIYLAESDDDAAEYREEAGEHAAPIYRRTGSVWEGR